MPSPEAPRPVVRVARAVVQPVQAFLAVEASGGIVLLAATVVALVLANSPLDDRYADVLHHVIRLGPEHLHLGQTVEHWVNDGLMAIFFFVVGLEIKRELVAGELRDRRAAAVPALAALGGMVVPAALYLLVNRGSGEAGHGWGIPMATDIAFVLGVVAVLGRRVPPALRLFLLTLAIVDDLGAIVVIAVVYSGSIALGWLAAAVGVVVAVVVLRLVLARRPAGGPTGGWHAVFVLLGVGLWFCVFQSGVHATLAGVAMGLLTPAVPAGDGGGSVAERVEHLLHPWSSYLVVPVFALVNAGVSFSGASSLAGQPVALGVLVGLVAGKAAGVSGATWLACRLGLGGLPAETSWRQLVGAAVLAGIGFTVALFIAGLAFDAPAHVREAKIGILLASLLAALVGSVLLAAPVRRSGGPRPSSAPSGPS